MRSLTAAAASAALLLVLTGCSIAVSEPAPEPVATTDETATASTPEAESPSEEQSSPEPVTDAGTWSAEVAEARADALALVTKTVRCDGELLLGDTADAEIVQVDGACEHLAIRMDGGVVIASDVVTLDLSGDADIVYVDSVSVLNVAGSGNVVYWSGQTPKLTETGDANLLTAG